ncbi:MAG: ankyrin repeat domain-containing protein [Ruminococcus sp.]|nr:ankyrin repeat domain-containing protein [Ruminococcus sp.]
MAFIALVFVFMLVFAMFIFFIVGIVLVKLSQRKARKARKAAAEIGAEYVRPKGVLSKRVIGIIFIIPFTVLMVVSVSYISISLYKSSKSLVSSVQSGNVENVERLLEKGSDPNVNLSNEALEDGEESLLSYLCQYDSEAISNAGGFSDISKSERLEIIELLIEYGADVNAVSYSDEKNSSNHYTSGNTTHLSDKCGYTPLMYAVEICDYDAVRLLIDCGADVTCKNYCGFTVLEIFAQYAEDTNTQAYDLLKLLIESGAPTDNVTNFGQTTMGVWREAQDWGLDNNHIYDLLNEQGIK